MKFFYDIRQKYGQQTVLEIQNFEKLEIKAARFRNHIIFNLRCRDENLSPPNLRLKCPINTNNARDIVRKAQKDILRKRIRVNNNKLDHFNEEIKRKNNVCSNDWVCYGRPLVSYHGQPFHGRSGRKGNSQAPEICKPSLWKRYVDDILEKVKKGTTGMLTDHLNTIDDTGNIKFTVEEETEGKLAFLDTMIVKKTDGSVKLQVYRKPDHTNQYLMFSSHHPVQHKFSVVKTLLDRKDNIVTDEEDKIKETQHVKTTLKNCGYPNWTFKKVEQDIIRKNDKSQEAQGNKPTKSRDEPKSIVVLPYVKGVSERIQRSMKKHREECPVKPHRTLRQLLVHPKDKIEKEQKCGVVYEIPCQSCQLSYIGETGIKFGTRFEEHKTEVNKLTSGTMTRARKTSTIGKETKSAIKDHARDNNHVMNWADSAILHKEGDRYRRWIRESLWIRRRRSTLNRDERGYELSHIWDPLIPQVPPRGRTHLAKPLSSGRSRQQRHQPTGGASF